MTSFVLDTHILLWLFNENPILPPKARSIILSPNNEFHYSVVSVWEVSIKHAKDVRAMNTSEVQFLHYCQQSGFKKLAVDDRHVLALETLQRLEDSPPHKNPFDRIMLARQRRTASCSSPTTSGSPVTTSHILSWCNGLALTIPRSPAPAQCRWRPT